MLFEIIVLILGIPVGLLIAYWANDELVVGRKWFLAVIALAVVVGLWSALTRGEDAVAWTARFAIVVTAMSYWKSFDKKWCKRRI